MVSVLKPTYTTLLIGYATGKQIQTRIRTNGATVAPIANPYREQTDCGIICTSRKGSISSPIDNKNAYTTNLKA